MGRIFIASKRVGSPCRTMAAGFLFALTAFLLPCEAFGENVVYLGGWSRGDIERLLSDAARIPEQGRKVEFLSAAFLDTPYLADTLVGSAETPEVLVLRLDGVDCFTFLDYLEALRRSFDFDGFQEALLHIRYRQGRVAFLSRNHFFSEWGEANAGHLREVTAQVGGEEVRRVEKQLNRKADGALCLPGYPVKRREINYIPPEAVDASVLARLQGGDYVGIYSPLPGLDVSHCGVVVKKEGKVFLRHAASSSHLRKVTDEELISYLGGRKGLVVYRPVAERKDENLEPNKLRNQSKTTLKPRSLRSLEAQGPQRKTTSISVTSASRATARSGRELGQLKSWSFPFEKRLHRHAELSNQKEN